MSGAKDNSSPDTTQASPEETEGQHDTNAAKAFYDSIAPKKKPKMPKPQNAITIAVSSRVLFNMVQERKMYEEEGVEKYVLYQQEHEEEPLKPGPAFPFVKALEEVNKHLRLLYPDSEELFDIVLMTNNHAQVGVRLINSINHYGLNIERFCMTGGKSPIGYLKAYLTNLYLSKDSEKVQEAIAEGNGPLKGFLEALGKLQRKFYAKDARLVCPIRTYLVTARSAASSGARVLKTLRAWGLEIDEALFLAGAPKGPILDKIRPHLFFDDQMFHVEGAQELGTIAAHVPYGIGQKYHKSTLKEEAKKDPEKN
ncbi:hypothetical protein GDO78_002131 [Eleutherodactylus coqui]|uniref:Cytosolic 5'-nucleotidase 1A-like n=1 Tax=Eleutherodactylus coqui TaxID=57060 RepID=A0A8J6KI20_ELECQ|nr:hypothetical protein GDO78_002131 [Eleutherodactylus coqui]